MPRFVALLALVLLALPTRAQDRGAINGYVRDATTGETLLGANVVVSGTPRGTATNTAGFYALASLRPGSYTLTASFLGYRDASRTVTLEPYATLRLDFELTPEDVEQAEVVVEAEEPIEEERAVGVQQVPIRVIQQLPSVFEDDLFRSIQLLPGIKAASDYSSKLYIRGGSPDQTLILLDGTTVYNPTHFFGFFSTFNTDAIKDVRVYKGAYPSTYGGRLGSVIDIYNRDGNRNEVAGMVSLGMLASRVGIEGPVTAGDARGSYMVAARRSTLEPLLAVLRNTLEDDAIPESFYFYDVNAKFGLDLTSRDRFSIAGYAGRDEVRIPFAADAAFDLDYGNQTLSLGYTRILSEAAFATFRATGSRYFSNPTGEVAGTTFQRPNEIVDFSGRADFDWLPNRKFEAHTGVWGGWLRLGLRNVFDEVERLNVRIPATYLSSYAQTVWRPTPGWILTGGLRGEFFGAGDYFRLSPHLQIERKFGDGAVVQLAGGRYHQFLTLISNEVFSGFDVWTTTGEGVPPAYSDQIVFGVKTRLPAGFRFDTEVYGRTMRDLFEIRPELQDVSGLDYHELFRFGEGYAYGAEFLLERSEGRLNGLLGYTLSTVRRRYPNNPGFVDFFPPKYDRLHDFTAVLTYHLGRGWSLSGAGTYATGQAYTEPTGRYMVDNLPFIPGDLNVLVSNQLNGQRLPPYHRLDFGVTKVGEVLGADYEVQVQAVNVYNRRNLWFYFLDTSENPINRDPVRQLPILPNVSVTLRF